MVAKLALLALAASVAFNVAVAQPQHRHRRHNKERAVYTMTATATQYVEVDENGNLIVETPTPAADSVYVPAATATYVAASSSTPATTFKKHTKTKTTSTPQSTATGSAADGYFGKAIVYSPYHNDQSCKDATDVATDLAAIMGSGSTTNYAGVRLYGVDCDQVANVVPVARKMGFKVMLGVYDITQAAANAQTMADVLGSDWSVVHSVAVGNEEVNKAVLAGQDGNTAATNVMAAVKTVKDVLTTAGYTGPVVNPEVFTRFAEYPALCGSETFVAANCHPFFDGSVAASGAGDFLSTQSAVVEKACNKPVLITETGWPSQGDANGAAVPSSDNQKSVISQACTSLNDNVILLGAFNDFWKVNFGGSYNAEEYWGILGNSVTN